MLKLQGVFLFLYNGSFGTVEEQQIIMISILMSDLCLNILQVSVEP